MAEPVPAGSDVSAGTYKCTQCGNELTVGSTDHLPPCPSCGKPYAQARGSSPSGIVYAHADGRECRSG